MKHNIPLKYIALVGVFAIVALVATSVGAWQAPTSAAPGGNVAAPINTGSVQQTKNGTLGIAGSAVVGQQISVVGGLRATGISGNATANIGKGFVAARQFCLGGFNAVSTGIPGQATGTTPGSGQTGFLVPESANAQSVAAELDCISSWSQITAALGLSNGTVEGQTLRWNMATSKWEANSFLRVESSIDNQSQVLIGTTATPKNANRLSVSGNVSIRPDLYASPASTEIGLKLGGRIQIMGGTPAAGKVLTAQGTDGNATWSNLSQNVRMYTRRISGVGAGAGIQTIAFCGTDLSGNIVDSDWATNGKAIAGSVICGNRGNTPYGAQTVASYPASSGQSFTSFAPVSGNASYAPAQNGWLGVCKMAPATDPDYNYIQVSVTCIK